MRTVKNIADLRQNLEETMSSLRGTQISHRFSSLLPIGAHKEKTIIIEHVTSYNNQERILVFPYCFLP